MHSYSSSFRQQNEYTGDAHCVLVDLCGLQGPGKPSVVLGIIAVAGDSVNCVCCSLVDSM